jgi:aspartate/methionine/tyrosine aminotransferase
MVKIVSRIADSKQILIKQIAAETNRLIAEENASIVSLAQGSPNLPIFEHAYESMSNLLSQRKLPYTDVNGLLRVRQVASSFVNKFYGRDFYDSNNVIITAGAVQSVYNVLALSVENKQDVVVSPLPAYGLYKHQTELLGGTFVPIHTRKENDFVPTVEDLRKIFEDNIVVDDQGKKHLKIKSLVLCYPNNPAGSSLSGENAKAIADFLDEMLEQFPDPGFSLVLDEVYLGIIAQAVEHYQSILMYASPRLIQSIFLILSVSKGLGAMPGMRAGFVCCANQFCVDSMIKVQQACTANASILAQEGLYASLSHVIQNPQVLQEVSSYYQERTKYTVDRLNSIGQKYLNGSVIAKQPEATFYVFADFSALKQTDVEIQEFFRDMYKNGSKKIGVACVPGVAFAMESEQRLIRFSCAVEMSQLEIAMDVIEEAVQLLLEKQ